MSERNIVELCRENCRHGVRPSADEALQLIAEIDGLRKPWRAVDGMDWEYLFSVLGYGGRDQFWRAVLTEMQLALAGQPQEAKE